MAYRYRRRAVVKPAVRAVPAVRAKPAVPAAKPKAKVKVTDGRASKKYEVTGVAGAARVVALEPKVRELLVEKLKEKGLSLVSLKFSDYKIAGVLGTGHEIKFKAQVGGSPIAPLVLVGVLGAVAVAGAVLAVTFGEFVIKPIFVGAPAPPPPTPPPQGAPKEVWEKYYSAYESTPAAPTAPIAQILSPQTLLPLALLAGAIFILPKVMPKKKEEVKPT